MASIGYKPFYPAPEGIRILNDSFYPGPEGVRILNDSDTSDGTSDDSSADIDEIGIANMSVLEAMD